MSDYLSKPDNPSTKLTDLDIDVEWRGVVYVLDRACRDELMCNVRLLLLTEKHHHINAIRGGPIKTSHFTFVFIFDNY